jgi:hypothetical protein
MVARSAIRAPALRNPETSEKRDAHRIGR